MLKDVRRHRTIPVSGLQGVGYSPLYLNYERGTTSVGNGSISYFFLVTPDNFSMEIYTDIYLTLDEKYFIYTDEYFWLTQI